MRHLILVQLILSGFLCHGQKGQFTFQLNSGFYYFGGSTAGKTTALVISDVSGIPNQTAYPFGTKSGFSYGFGAQYQRITRAEFLFGLQLNYESLSSKIIINKAYGDSPVEVKEGHAILTNNFINLNPYIGKRFKLIKGLDTDVLAGLDMGFGLSGYERYSMTTKSGDEFSGKNETESPIIDYRPRIELVNYYQQFGLSFGYSYGLTNYLADYILPDKESASRYFRIGLHYRLI